MAKEAPMRFIAPLSPYDRFKNIGEIGEVARLAEGLGFYGVALPEHVIMPQKGDGLPTRTMWYDNFALGAHLATLTERLRIIFTVMIVPYRPPIQAAKLISTLDVVSKGRLICGVGAGWLRGEFRTLGVPHAERGAMTDEYLRAMRALWTQERPSFEGKYARFSNIAFEPKCHQKPHVRLWMGGSGERVIRRIAELGDGWMPMSGTLKEIGADIGTIKRATAEAGRDPEALDFCYSMIVGERDEESERSRAHPTGGRTTVRRDYLTAQDAIAGVREHQAVGLNHLLLSFNWRTADELQEHMCRFSKEVMPAFCQ